MTQDREALEVADRFVYTTGKAVLNGDYKLFRSHFRLPYDVGANDFTTVIETEDEMLAHFDTVQQFYRDNDIRDLVRTVVEASFLEPDVIGVTFVSNLIKADGKTLEMPFPAYSNIGRRGGVWKIEATLYAILGSDTLRDVYSARPTARKTSKPPHC